jgi:hypothetical protein
LFFLFFQAYVAGLTALSRSAPHLFSTSAAISLLHALSLEIPRTAATARALPQPKIPPEVDAATHPRPDVAAAVQALGLQEAREAEEDEEREVADREEEEKALCDLLVYRLRLEKKV